MPMYGSESTAAPKNAFDMDNEGENQFCRFVEKMPAKPDGMIRLFDRGDYFSAHGSDALIVAHEVYKTTNVLKYLGRGLQPNPSSASAGAITAKGLASVTISKTLTKNFLRECLTARQMRIEIYEPEEAAGGRKNNARWVLGKVASPGNIAQVEDLLFADSDLVSNAVSMAIRVQIREGQRTVGCAVVDVQDKVIRLSEFVDDENYGNTESLLIQLGVKECLVPEDKGTDHEVAKLKTLIERCGVIITERRSADFSAKKGEDDLKLLLYDTSSFSALSELDLKQAMSALAALLIYLSLPSDLSLQGQFRLARHDLSQYMKLDASALKALNLMPNPQELGGNKNMSVFGLLDRCKTSQGKRLLGRWLKQPLVNLHEIVKRQNIVEAFFDDAVNRRAIQEDILDRMPDFHRISKKFHRKAASLEDVVRIYQAIGKLPRLVDLLLSIEPYDPQGKELLEETYVAPLRDHMEKLEKYSEMVEETIDLDNSDPHSYVLLPTLDNKLQEYRDQLNEVVDQLDAEHARVGRDLGVDIEKKLHLEKHQVYNYSLRITKAEAGLIRNRKEYIDLSTQKSGTIFTTKHLRQLSEQFDDLNKAYEKTQRELVREVVAIAATYAPILEVFDNLIAAIDVTISLAHVAANARIPYIRPKLTEKGSGNVIVKGARHPCLEEQPDVEFISNDHEMHKGKSEFVILTGPNMGGKSTYIRQIGVIALMAQVGSFVPADEATLPIFDCILARVGAGDSQLKGVSTFMAEMLETATILKSATADSLIIIDELGRGTSTYDGFGLAWAISEHIASKIQCFCLFATHFHELTTLDQSLPHVTNLHVVAHVQPRQDGGGVGGKAENEITLLYQVKDGICDQSFGIHVAELADFPESVVKLAKRKAEELEDFGDGAAEATFAKFSKTETEQGTELVKSFLDTWKSRVQGHQGLSEDEQVEELKKVADEYKERFEGNPWVKGLCESF